MDQKEIRMYLFFGIGSILLVNYMKTQLSDLIRGDLTNVVKDGARSVGSGLGGGIGTGVGTGLVDGILNLFANSPTSEQ